MSEHDDLAEVEEKIEDARHRLEEHEERTHTGPTFVDADEDGEPDEVDAPPPG
jgi:hypothetical protein